MSTMDVIRLSDGSPLREVVINYGGTMARTRRIVMAWADTASEATAARKAGNTAGSRDAGYRHDCTTVAALVLATDLCPETKRRMDAREFAGAEEPYVAIGEAAAEELEAAGWHPAHVAHIGTTVMQRYVARIEHDPTAAEVSAMVADFPAATEQTT